ncbi:MAG: TRAM domain-containing protein [Schwartzia sp.]|nr:TRAM domain-containing protein [Schwartzia sp. (in: firmicutes)]MBO6235946.1 TRAM domain-containing protein [Schwartzia sp. (in: firmicutes)]
MLDKVLRFFIVAVMAVAGAALMQPASPTLTQFIGTEILKTDMGLFRMTLAGLLCILAGAALGALVGSLTASYLISTLKRFSAWVETQLNKMPIHDVLAGAIGLSLGLILATLLGGAFSRIPIVGNYLPVVFAIVFGYLGIRITMTKREEIADMFSFIPRFFKDVLKAREVRQEPAPAPIPEPLPEIKTEMPETGEDKRYKLLDTSAIIDGRIADVIDSGFLEGTLLIPVFVLEELQRIADSADALKRVRGRRGLDILQKIRSEAKLAVEIDSRDFDDIAEVDSKLVRLGQLVGGKIVTNDYNLNKVSELQGVPVLNVNELANAVKPVVVPGESMRVTVVKDGKEQGQGVAYLDDGTMIVIEGGHRHLNQNIDVEVTSALQTAAGRMIFAKPRRLAKN